MAADAVNFTVTDAEIVTLIEELASLRAAYHVAVEMLGDRERRLRLAREHHVRMREELRSLRASIMRSDIGRAAA